MSVNKAILVGFVGNDPEVRYLDSGAAVANFRLATSENYTNRAGEKVSQTEWHNVVLWRGLAEIAEKYVKKGTQIYIEGRIRTRSWDDRDGNKRYTTEIVGDNMQLMGRRGDNVSDGPTERNEAPQSNAASQPMEKPEPDNDGTDDLPF
jgi:single-strand DNA-binding protein